MKKNKGKITHLLYNIILILSILWVSISTLIQALVCPKMTQTELFLHIPKSFICVWEYCM